MDTITKINEVFAQSLKKAVEHGSYRGREWWQLQDCEAEVFGLEVDDIPALVAAWELFEAIADAGQNDFHGTPLCCEARAALPFIAAKGGEPYQCDQWTEFARLLGIRGRKANAWFHKFMFALDRDGVMVWSDDDLPMPSKRANDRSMSNGA